MLYFEISKILGDRPLHRLGGNTHLQIPPLYPHCSFDKSNTDDNDDDDDDNALHFICTADI